MSKADTQRPRLGRGLSSLINVSDLPVEKSVAPTGPDAPAPDLKPEPVPSVPRGTIAPDPTEVQGAMVIDVPIDQITPNPHQPRRTMNDATLVELAASIKATGLIQPILVRRTADGTIQLIAGERRWRASKLAGLKTIPAIVKDVDGFTQAQMALIENIQREDLNPIDRALGYRSLIQQLGLTQHELAGRLGEDRASVGHFMRLLDLAPAVQELVKSGQVSLGHAKLLVNVPDPKEQQRLAQLVVQQSLAVRNLERLINGGGAKGVNREKIAAGNSMHLLDLEKNIARHLGMKVAIRAHRTAKGKGSIKIQYGSLDQFDDLMSRLGIKLDG